MLPAQRSMGGKVGWVPQACTCPAPSPLLTQQLLPCRCPAGRQAHLFGPHFHILHGGHLQPVLHLSLLALPPSRAAHPGGQLACFRAAGMACMDGMQLLRVQGGRKRGLDRRSCRSCPTRLLTPSAPGFAHTQVPAATQPEVAAGEGTAAAEALADVQLTTPAQPATATAARQGVSAPRSRAHQTQQAQLHRLSSGSTPLQAAERGAAGTVEHT